MEAFRLSSLNIRKIVSVLIFLSIASLIALLFSDDDPSELNRIQVSLLAVNLISFFASSNCCVERKKLVLDYRQENWGQN